jgi:hypothetical protein
LLPDPSIGLPLLAALEVCCVDGTSTPDPGEAPTAAYFPRADPFAPPWLVASTAKPHWCDDVNGQVLLGSSDDRWTAYGPNRAIEFSNFSDGRPRVVRAEIGGRCRSITTWDLPAAELSAALPTARLLADGSVELPALHDRFDRTTHPAIDGRPVTFARYGGQRFETRLAIWVSPRTPAHRADALASLTDVLASGAPLRRLDLGGRVAVGRIGRATRDGLSFVVVIDDPDQDRIVTLGGSAPNEETLDRWIQGLRTVTYDEWAGAVEACKVEDGEEAVC